MEGKIIRGTIKEGKQKNDLHPHFRNHKLKEEIACRVRFKRAIRRLMGVCK